MAPRTLLALLFVALTAIGCVPEVQLKSAALRGATPTGVRFDAMLAIHNPNTFDVEVREVRANVRMENVRGYLPVQVSPQVWIPSNSTRVVAVPITVPWAMAPQILAATVTQPKVAYNVIGTADITATSGMKLRIDMYEFDEEGELPRSMFVQIGGGGPFTIGLGNR
ncbi:MAG: LEA type 2 family protein [Polyangiaceae bacterium]|nr:LEA type 2 family protein [Polyangiaceae bacterium]